MSTLYIRSADLDVTGDGRNLEGVAFRWETPSLVSDDGGRTKYLEEFDRSSTNRTLGARRQLFVEHQHLDGSVGDVRFERSLEGLVFRARVSDSEWAGETLERVNNGELRAVSVGFYGMRSVNRMDGAGRRVTRRTEIGIRELSLARTGQHEGAGVLAVRSEALSLSAFDDRRRRLALGVRR